MPFVDSHAAANYEQNDASWHFQCTPPPRKSKSPSKKQSTAAKERPNFYYQGQENLAEDAQTNLMMQNVVSNIKSKQTVNLGVTTQMLGSADLSFVSPNLSQKY